MSVSIDRIDMQPLSKRTKEEYRTKLDYLVRKLGFSIEFMMLNPNPTLRLMKSAISDKAASLAAYITPICKMYQIHPTFTQSHKEEYAKWRTYLNHYMNKRMLEYDTNTLTQSQKDKAISMEEVKKKYKELEDDGKTFTDFKQHLRYILLAIFLNTKPKRADFGEAYISVDGTIPDAFLKKNYIVLRDGDNRLVLNDYKTFKHHGTIHENLSPELVTVLKRSLSLFPREYLFISMDARAKGQPYTKNNSYSQYVKRAFEKMFGKSMGVSLWRKVYVSETVDFNGTTYEELKANARLACQTVESQLRVYKALDLRK